MVLGKKLVQFFPILIYNEVMKNTKKKKRPIGRPRGKHGDYKPPYLKRRTISVSLPEWLLAKLEAKDLVVSKYIKNLILTDTSWKIPKS